MKAAFEKSTAAKCEKRSTEEGKRGRGGRGKEEGSAVQPVSYVKGGGRLAADPQNNSRGSCRLLTLRLKWSTPEEREREESRGARGAWAGPANCQWHR